VTKESTAVATAGVAMPEFDWKDPDYGEVYRRRMKMLEWIREHPEELPAIKAYYKSAPADFITDWGMTFEPRNAEIGLPAYVPFILFPRQRDWIDFVLRKWRERKPGLCEKSRDMGVSWLAMSLGCTLCIFYEGMAIGVGSRKSDYVDKLNTMKPLLPKARIFMEHLPVEFRGGWEAWRDAPYMRINFPETGSFMGGEGGDDLGRGDRTSIYFVDEYAHFERPELTEASLSQTTNCRIDMSSVRGMNNPFAQKRWGGKIEVFIFDWREDPRKDDAWYEEQCNRFDPVVVAQEIDRDYQASVHGVVIPAVWVRSAIGALAKLGIAPTGARDMALDVADEGVDKNALCGRTGTQVDYLEQWSGKGSDTFATVEHAFEVADERGYDTFRYDGDGIGALVRGDARVINARRREANARRIRAEGFRGSDAVFDPDGIVEGTMGGEGDKGRTNKDYFANRKAQGWWSVRRRFQRTFRWVVGGVPCAPDDIISLDPGMPLLQQLVAELSQPTYETNGVGKIVINKKPDGMPSPNLADALMMRYAPNELPPLNVSQELVAQIVRAGLTVRRRR
jgi:phage terminase large subunit